LIFSIILLNILFGLEMTVYVSRFTRMQGFIHA